MKFVLDEKILLGEGMFSRIFHGTLDSETIAAKKSVKDSLLLKEASFLKRCNHQNVVKYKGFTEFKNEAYLIMEYAQGGSLQENLGQNKFSPAQKRLFVRQMCLGLEHIHSLGILHRDIKPENLLFRDFQNLVISDFAMAQDFQKDPPVRNTHDVVKDPIYTFKGDIYLAALVVYQIFADRKQVKRSQLGDEIQRAHESGDLMSKVFEKPTWERTIMDSLYWKPEKRPTAKEFRRAFRE